MSELYGKKFIFVHSSIVARKITVNCSCPMVTVALLILETTAGMEYDWKPVVPMVVPMNPSNAGDHVIVADPAVKYTLRESLPSTVVRELVHAPVRPVVHVIAVDPFVYVTG